MYMKGKDLGCVWWEGWRSTKSAEKPDFWEILGVPE